MDLLDLELDLHVEPSAIRRSARTSQAASSSSSSTPKAAPKVADKAAKPEKPAVVATPKTAPKRALPKGVEAVRDIKEEPSSSPSSHTSRVSSTERDSRSASLDKRSRNKATKRFSPSPDTPASKKRKAAAAAAVVKQVTTPAAKPTPAAKSTPAVIPTKKQVADNAETPGNASKIIKICSGREFANGLAELSEKYKIRGPVDYELPPNFKGRKPSETVNQIIKTDFSVSARKGPVPLKDSAPSVTPPADPTNEDPTENEEEPEELKEEPKEQKRGKGRPKRMQTPRFTKESAEASDTGEGPSSSKDEFQDLDPLEEDTKKSPKKVIPTPQRRMSARKLKNNSEVDASLDEQIALNPNSALAIRQRLMASGGSIVKKPGRKSKIAEDHIEQKPEPEAQPKIAKSPVKSSPKKATISTPITPSTALPAALASSAKAQGPTPRSSGRVSKPNRLYADQTFNTEILGRKTVTEQNEVLEAIARDATPDPEPSVPSTSTAPPRSATASKKRPVVHREYVPKPVSLLNGVTRGYVASVKEPLEDIEVDGVVVKLNEVVNEVMDTLLLEVCADGVLHHENIDPAVVKAKRIAKTHLTKKMKSEAKKLDIQMKLPTGSSYSGTEETGKRKRHAPKTDDMYWTPAEKWSKHITVKGEPRKEGGADIEGHADSKESTPEPEEIGRREEKRQQAARQSISTLFDSEIEQSIKEGKRFTLSFEKYMIPKIARTQKKAGIKLMSTERKTTYSDDFYYHELLAEQPQPSSISPSLSNVENVDVEGFDNVQEEPKYDSSQQIEPIDEPISQEAAISIRTDALDIAEQIAVLIQRPTQHDGSEVPLEELLNKSVEQTETRRVALTVAMDIVVDQLAHESAPPPADVETTGCVWNTITQKNARRLKDVFTISSAERESAISWVHKFLVESLPVHVLASYLSVLRYARRMSEFQTPSRFASIITSTSDLEGEWLQATKLLKSFVYKRSTEPGAEVLDHTVPYCRMPDTVFLLVSPTMALGGPSRPVLQQQRQHAHLFKWLQAIGHPDSEMIGFSDDQDFSLAEYLSDIVITAICNKVREKRRDLPNSKIVLVGYGASTYLTHRAANLVKGIWALISVGFPVMTKFGRRGTADDEILLTYCPTLFVVGAEGRRFNNEALTELRSSMMTASGLVVVGHANDHLLVPSSVLVRLGVSQRIVFRMVLEKILDFLSLEKVREQNLADLKPMELNNVYDMDSSLLKSEKALSGLAFANSPTPAPLGASGRRATVSGAEEGNTRKRKADPPQSTPSASSGAPSSSQPSPLSSMFPSRIPMPPPSPAAQGHFQSFQTLMAQSVSTGIDDMPRRASMGASPRVVERGDFKDRAAALAANRPAASRQSAQSKGPIDPASISLN